MTEEQRLLLIQLLVEWEYDLVEAGQGSRSPLMVCWAMRPEASRLISALQDGESLEEVFKLRRQEP